MNPARSRLRRRLAATLRYVRLVVSQFLLTFLLIAALLLIGTFLHRSYPVPELGGAHPDFFQGLFATYALFAMQPVYALPPHAWLRLVYFVYPLFGLAVVADTVVRVSLLLFARQENQKEWTKVLASTYRNHVILCGLGRVGFRILQRLHQYNMDVVVIEKDERSQFLQAALRMKIPVLHLDAKQEESLEEAGLRHARALVIATNDDLANVEIALDARRLCPGIRVVLRMFDEGIADKLREAFQLDMAFSSAAAAAPMVAASLLELDILSSFHVDGHVDGKEIFTARLKIPAESPLVGRALSQLAAEFHVLVVSRRPADRTSGSRSGAVLGPAPSEIVAAQDELIVQGELDSLRRLSKRLG